MEKGMHQVKRIMLLLWFVVTSLAAAPVNVNTANAEEIAEALYGVGKYKAQAIVRYRQEHGHFRSVQALKKVRGIGQGILDGNLDDIKIE
jgi:competence protein ComEA